MRSTCFKLTKYPQLSKLIGILTLGIVIVGCDESKIDHISSIDPKPLHDTNNPTAPTKNTKSHIKEHPENKPSDSYDIATTHGPIENSTTESEQKGLAAELIESHAPRNNIEEARNKTVFIDSGFGSGSGFFIDEECTIVTNRHVIQLDYKSIKDLEQRRKEVERRLERGISRRDERHNLQKEQEYLNKAAKAYHSNGTAKKLKVSFINGREILAKVKGVSSKYDLAYLYIKEQSCPFFMANTENDLPLGNKVLTIGNPAGMRYTVTSGIISGYQKHDGIEFIQTDAAINPGNSGGPLINTQGQILGINTLILSGTEGIGFALPSGNLIEDMASLEDDMKKKISSANFQHWNKQCDDCNNEKEKNKLNNIIHDSRMSCLEAFDENEYGLAYDECLIAAEYEDPQSQFILAEIYIQSENKNENEKAIEFYKKSARNGYAEALNKMAVFHKNGKHVKKNTNLASDLYLESCEKKYASACNSYAIELLDKQEYKKAADYLDKAINYGSVLAIFNKGHTFEKGWGVIKSPEKAFENFKKAAYLGSNISQYRMFWHSYKGKETERDYTKAYAWLIVSETGTREEYDFIEGWDNSMPANARFFLDRITNDNQRIMARSKAASLKKQIDKKSKKHKNKHLFQRGKKTEESDNTQS